MGGGWWRVWIILPPFSKNLPQIRSGQCYTIYFFDINYTMIIISILLKLISNAVRAPIRKEPIRDISVIFNRIAIIALIFCILQVMINLFIINDDIGLLGGLLYTTNITQTFHMFIFIISILILILTSFYSNSSTIQKYTKAGLQSRLPLFKHVNKYENKTLKDKIGFAKGKIFMSTMTSSASNRISSLGGNLNQYSNLNSHLNIPNYPLIILFVIIGANFLISTNDLVSIFLSIELQSYGLYILSTIYRNSELSTAGGLIWATVRVYLKVCDVISAQRPKSLSNGIEENAKDHRSNPQLVTGRGQEPDRKGNMRHTVVLALRYVAKRILEVEDVKWIRLICRRLSNFGSTSTYSRVQLLLEYSINRVV